jgi:hypothetical protein
MFKAVCKLGLEGIVSKKFNAPYKSRAIKDVAENQKPQGAGCHSCTRWDILMNRKFIIAILLVAAVPVLAQAQKPWVTKDDAQKVVTIISGDKAKIQTYCEIQTLVEQMERANEKRNLKLVEVKNANIAANDATILS